MGWLVFASLILFDKLIFIKCLSYCVARFNFIVGLTRDLFFFGPASIVLNLVARAISGLNSALPLVES